MIMRFNPKKQLEEFLAEDIGKGDITSTLLTRKKISARIISKEDAVVAGTSFAKEIFRLNGCKVRILKRDGSKIRPQQVIMTITGDAKNILECERTALNLLTRMSGIATATDRLIKKIPKTVKLYATRKTAPGLRYFDKQAVEIGGGYKHRFRLDEMVRIKDNHIAAEGSMVSLIQKAKKRYKKFEVEVESTQDAVIAAKQGAAIIMLDNFFHSTDHKNHKDSARAKTAGQGDAGGVRRNQLKEYLKIRSNKSGYNFSRRHYKLCQRHRHESGDLRI